jgi:hypothetical protein
VSELFATTSNIISVFRSHKEFYIRKTPITLETAKHYNINYEPVQYYNNSIYDKPDESGFAFPVLTICSGMNMHE